MEIINIPADVRAAMYKVASINLCSNVNGQICTAMVMNPPKVSSPLLCCALYFQLAVLWYAVRNGARSAVLCIFLALPCC